MRIELQNIHKHYGMIKANNGVNLTIEPGTIHGILGENGAGKSTLMKILAGFCNQTSGTILLDKKAVTYLNPAQASTYGIGMLYQDPFDFPLLTVLDNFMTGLAHGLKNKKKRFKKLFLEYSKNLKFHLNLDTQVKNLTIGERQQLEIIRLLALGIQVLILDEPTTGISSIQKEVLFTALIKLASEGRSIILVSHKLEDVEALCHSVTVLRQGKVSGKMNAPFNTEKLLKMMFETLPASPSRLKNIPGKKIIHLDGISVKGGRTGLKDCTIKIRQKEIVGLAGLEGSGQGVFLRAAAGLTNPYRGRIHVQDSELSGMDYRIYRDRGISFLPGSRLEEGLITGLSITEHYALKKKHGEFFVKWRNVEKNSARGIDLFRIKGSIESQVEELSGGNQQRLLLSLLPPDPLLLLLENPTRGLDMESMLWVWEHLQRYCESDTGIVFSSSELDEILMFADRVLVFFNGRIIKNLKTDQTDIHTLGRAIAGKN